MLLFSTDGYAETGRRSRGEERAKAAGCSLLFRHTHFLESSPHCPFSPLMNDTVPRSCAVYRATSVALTSGILFSPHPSRVGLVSARTLFFWKTRKQTQFDDLAGHMMLGAELGWRAAGPCVQSHDINRNYSPSPVSHFASQKLPDDVHIFVIQDTVG